MRFVNMPAWSWSIEPDARWSTYENFDTASRTRTFLGLGGLTKSCRSTLSFVVLLLMATWYVIPWLKSRSRADALTALLWVQAFRYIALQIFSSQKFGFAVSDGARDQIAAGDVAGMILALIAIVALRYRLRVATLLVWGGNRARSCERDDR